MNIQTMESKAVARPLRVLVPLIKDDLRSGNEAAEAAGMPYYRAAGEKLIEAKPQLNGGFRSWVKRNFKISDATATLYMSYARATSGKQKARPAYDSLADFKRRGMGHQAIPGSQRDKEWREPVSDIMRKAQANAARLAEESLNRAEEREAQRKLALQLIDIGYKALASKLHPDKGGSRDAMARLNTVRERLKACA